MRIFIKYFKNYNPDSISPELLKHFSQIEKKLLARETNNFNISDLLLLMKHKNPELEGWNRRMMMETLSTKIKE